uniref:Ribosomal protein L16 n=1 Tax=Lithodesmium undulatum TaxID=59812 RepID=A0A7T7A9S4_LITUN|nr:ribosomal protein L16 [Lithodesmium undulatum]QQJ94660.1 ribosomal protein L16 [Lithodesmium undulatum]
MFLQPKKFKYKKIQKNKRLKIKYSSNELKFGNIGLKANQSGQITARQLESARQAIVRKIKRKGKFWITVFPNIPITKKPAEVRMGKGKGNVDYWAAKVKLGQILFEIAGVNFKNAKTAFKTGKAKLPIKTIIIV